MTSGSSTPRWRPRARTRIQPEAKAVTGSVRRRVQRSCRADGGAMTISPGSLSGASATRRMSPRSMPSDDVEVAHRFERAVQPDRACRSRRRAAVRSAAASCRGRRRRSGACGRQRWRRSASRRPISRASGSWRNTGRPKVASVTNRSQGTSSNGAVVGIGAALVVAGDHGAAAACIDHHLRAAEDVAGRRQPHGRAAEASVSP